MLKVEEYGYIRAAHRVYGKKIREIARDTGHSRNTVKKALKGEHSVYTPRGYQPYPALAPYLQIIDKWLEEDKKGLRSSGIRQLESIIVCNMNTTIRVVKAL